jgi:hypothetical protein
MLYQSLREYHQAPRLLLSWHSAAMPSQPHRSLFWKPLAHTAECLLATIGRTARREIQTDDLAWPAASRLPIGNIQYEIMRIEARRRI